MEDDILRSFGFDIDQKITNNKITIIEVNNIHYEFKTHIINSISEFISGSISDNTPIKLPSIIDKQFIDFLLDYAILVEKKGIPVFELSKIQEATVFEHIFSNELISIFVKHFDYKYMRSDIAFKQYLPIFGKFLNCSSAIISESLINIFSIAHKIIIQHLPSTAFIITE